MIADSKTAMPTIDFGRYRELLPPSAHQFVSELEASMSKFKVTKVETAPILQALEAERSEKVTILHCGRSINFVDDRGIEVLGGP